MFASKCRSRSGLGLATVGNGLGLSECCKHLGNCGDEAEIHQGEVAEKKYMGVWRWESGAS